MIKVTVIGSGNVAQHLATAFENAANIDLVQVFSRSGYFPNSIRPEKITSDLAQLQAADLYLLAITDDAIAEVSEQLPLEGKLVAHTSGSIPITALDKRNRKAVFYPLQTFSKTKAVDFRQVPICLESENAADFEVIEKVARSVSDKVFAINSQQRRAIHVSAVFVSNFVNHLYAIGNDICNENNIPFDILKPLIGETAQKVMTLSPPEAQTGPAKRNDQKTISAHLDLLTNGNRRRIYELLTQSIQSHE